MQIPNETLAEKQRVVSPWKVSPVPAFEVCSFVRFQVAGSKYSSGLPLKWKVWFGILRFEHPKLLGGGFKDFFLCSPLFGEMIPVFDEQMFQKGLVPPPTRLSTICKTKIKLR